MRIILYGEGESDEKILGNLLTNAVSAIKEKRIPLKPKNAGGIVLSKKAKRLAKIDLENDNENQVIMISDLKGPKFHIPKNAHVDEMVSILKKRMKEGIPKKYLNRYFPYVAVHELEAWLLADEKALSKRLSAYFRPWPNPELINMMDPPSNVLNELFRKHKNISYMKVRHGVELSQDADPGIIAQKCPHFRELIRGITTLIGSS